MFHGVLVSVVQPRKVRPWIGQSRLAEVEPHLPRGRLVQPIDPARSLHMERFQHQSEALGSGLVGGRVRDEMVVIGENRPCFELPAKVAGHGEESTMQNTNASCATEVVRLEVGAGGDEIRACRGKQVRWGMRPRRFRLGHGGTVVVSPGTSQSLKKRLQKR